MKAARGFTLIELIMFIVIVSAAVAGITLSFTQSTSHIHEPVLRQRALAVGNAYMDEILRKRWNENTPVEGGCVITGTGTCATPGAPVAGGLGPEIGETRASYDDVDDYYGTIISQVPTDQTGVAMPGYGDFRVTVTIANTAWQGVTSPDALQIDVAVTSPVGEVLSVRSYRVNF